MRTFIDQAKQTMKTITIQEGMSSRMVELSQDGRAVTTSLKVAEVFGRRHDLVLKAIRNLECSEEFGLRNFEESSYTNSQNKRQPMYLITRDGFSFLGMGFTGKEAARFKEAYIGAFNAMERALRQPAAKPHVSELPMLHTAQERGVTVRAVSVQGEWLVNLQDLLRAVGSRSRARRLALSLPLRHHCRRIKAQTLCQPVWWVTAEGERIIRMRAAVQPQLWQEGGCHV